MLLNQNTNDNYTARQLKLPLEIEKLIDISDPVYTFCEVMDHIDLSRYCSLREIEKLCRNDIRYMYLLDEMKAPTFATSEILSNVTMEVYNHIGEMTRIEKEIARLDSMVLNA